MLPYLFHLENKWVVLIKVMFRISIYIWVKITPFASVADPGCLYRILIFIHHGSRIPDPTTETFEKGEKIVVLHFCTHKYHKIENCFIFWANLQRIIVLRTPKNSKIWVWDGDPRIWGSGENLFRFQDSGVKKGPGSVKLFFFLAW
jgi:hypothetical protein